MIERTGIVHQVTTILTPSYEVGAVPIEVVPIWENLECNASQGADRSKVDDDACANKE